MPLTTWLEGRPLPGHTLPSPLVPWWTLLVKVVAILLQLVWMIKKHTGMHTVGTALAIAC